MGESLESEAEEEKNGNLLYHLERNIHKKALPQGRERKC